MTMHHIPAIILVTLLATAVILPAFKKFHQRMLKAMVSLSIVACAAMSVANLSFVISHGPFSYHMGNHSQAIGVEFYIDEIAAAIMVLILLLSPLIIMYSFADLKREIRPALHSTYYSLIFIMLFSMVGMMLSNDLFNLYVFMEILSISSCAIISVKKKGATIVASLKYLIQGTIGSVSYLMGIAFLYMVTGMLNMTLAHDLIQDAWVLYPKNILIALGFLLTGFGIKAAIFPLHTRLPDAHSTAPAPSSAFLSGLVVKVYIFAAIKVFFRVIGLNILLQLTIPMFITYFAMVGMIMGSFFAIGQKDIKRVLAYSSVAQIGYIALGIGLATPASLTVAMFHIASHALLKSALFLSAGAVIYQTGNRNIEDMTGVGYQMPITMSVFTIGAMGMIGIPGVNGFMSKWHLCLAALDAGRPIAVAVIILSSFLNLFYYLPIVARSFLLETHDHTNVMRRDKIPFLMKAPMIIIALLCVLFGFFPQLLMNTFRQAAATLFF